MKNKIKKQFDFKLKNFTPQVLQGVTTPSKFLNGKLGLEFSIEY